MKRRRQCSAALPDRACREVTTTGPRIVQGISPFHVIILLWNLAPGDRRKGRGGRVLFWRRCGFGGLGNIYLPEYLGGGVSSSDNDALLYTLSHIESA